MKDVPPKILKTFERMKKEESYHIELKFIGNNWADEKTFIQPVILIPFLFLFVTPSAIDNG